MSSKPTPCTCGAREKCAPRSVRVRHYEPAPGRPDPAEHFEGLGMRVEIAAAYGEAIEWRLWGLAKLWRRDGPGSPWHREYWQIWDRRQQGPALFRGGDDGADERGSQADGSVPVRRWTGLPPTG